MRPRQVEVSLPRFKVASAFGLKEELQALGIQDLFKVKVKAVNTVIVPRSRSSLLRRSR